MNDLAIGRSEKQNLTTDNAALRGGTPLLSKPSGEPMTRWPDLQMFRLAFFSGSL